MTARPRRLVAVMTPNANMVVRLLFQLYIWLTKFNDLIGVEGDFFQRGVLIDGQRVHHKKISDPWKRPE